HSVPAAAQDFGLQLIAARRPFRLAEQAEAAVERNPAHYLAVDMVAWGASSFPQALIRLFEVFGRERHQPFDQIAILRVELASQRRHQIRPVGKFAVDIELALIIGTVADPHRSAAAIPFKMLEDLLVERHFRADAIHDLDYSWPLAADELQESAECFRLAAVTEHREGEECEARVAEPAVSIIPVALAADFLRERGGSRGHDRPGRRIGQQLQREGAPHDNIAVWSVIPAIADPLDPECPRDCKQALDGFR